jgi:hypothetical protein
LNIINCHKMKTPVKIKDFFEAISKPISFGSGSFKLLVVFILLSRPEVFAQVGVHTDFPDASSAMDISANNKGLLIPRVTLSENLDDPSPVNLPAVGLLVFNSGTNQTMGFYYWDGSFWVPLAGGGGGGDGWSLTGNYGTEVGTNFIGTTDAVDFAVYTNAMERMRVLANGQVVIDSTAARFNYAMLSVFGNATQNYAINAYSPNVGLYTLAGVYGLVPRVNNSTGFPLYAKNTNAAGYGSFIVGSNIATAGYYPGRSSGLNSWGNDGIHAYGAATAYGIGIMSAGNNLTPVVLAEGAGGTFRGFWGIYGRSSSASGTAIIGLGNNQTTSFYLAGGSGGAFSGYDGVFGKGILGTGTGVIGLGNGIATAPTVISAGSGGAFTGTITGAGGWGATNGLIGWGTNAAAGTGIVGAGNNLATATLGGGSGGAFVGTNTGSVSWATSATGTGVIGAGNNLAASVYTGIGSGGAFTGTLAGAVAWGTNAASGTGVLGAGNNVAPTLPASGGCGGAFTGLTWGVYGYATNTGNVTRGGGYFACNPTSGGAYAYCGYRNNNTNYKTLGNGTNSTIVKNRQGELITLYCPEAPEVIFQDFGIGQLVDGKAHVTIDPDLSVNINVSEKHPLKVYVTPEGDCNGVYVTNKSVNGFDVIELQGGKSNVPFSWQIAATRANEEFVKKDGSIELTDYSRRFQPAPGPLEMVEQPSQTLQINESNILGQENQTTMKKPTGVLHEATEGKVIKVKDDLDDK